jgi:thiamine biosynthesis lipoprotein
MGTLVRIEIYTADEARAKSAFRAAFDRIAALDASLSDYRPESELNRLCRAPAGAAVTISADLFRVLAAAQTLAQQTGGAFDATIGPLTHLWRAARAQGRAPAPEAIAEAKSRTGYTKLRLDAAACTATLEEPGMQLDVGGIGKGYTADEALAVLAARGIRRALVAMSGDLAFSNPPPGRGGWKIATTYSTLELANAAVSTSGDAEQHLDEGGRRYSHVLNPATGLGITGSHDVSVIARRGIDADALATAASIVGPEALGCAAISKSEIDCSSRPSIDAFPRPRARDHHAPPSNPRPASATPCSPGF